MPLPSPVIQPASTHPFTIPLQDLDPYNLKYLQTAAFQELIVFYRMAAPTIDLSVLQSRQKDVFISFQQLANAQSEGVEGAPAAATTAQRTHFSHANDQTRSSSSHLPARQRYALLSMLYAKQLAINHAPVSLLIQLLLKHNNEDLLGEMNEDIAEWKDQQENEQAMDSQKNIGLCVRVTGSICCDEVVCV